MGFILGEEEKNYHLVRIHNKVMPTAIKLSCNRGLPQGVDPLEAPVLRAPIVEVVEALDSLLHFWAQVRILHLVRRPEPSREHSHVEVDTTKRSLSLSKLLGVVA